MTFTPIPLETAFISSRTSGANCSNAGIDAYGTVSLETLAHIDTNVFINYPEILSKIDAQYPIILSAKVIDELDKLKIRSEQEKKNAETALRLLNRENSRKIIFETADASLLPADYDRRSPDNLILSVALKYKDENPIMMTSDNGLQLKCKILGITTITLKAFLKQLKH
jgi:DNA replication ATP-dependent helicase Dna2